MTHTPDFQGVFLRGYGSVVSGHYGLIEHWSANLGELQGDSIRNIYGQIIDRGGRFENWNGMIESRYSGVNSQTDGTWTTYNNVLLFDASKIVPTANENRPVNKAVRYLIRAA